MTSGKVTARASAPSLAGQDSAALPLVSVCVPAHNVETTLDESLRSILAQTYPRIEVIVVDDGSSDRTPEVARTFSRVARYFRNAKQLGGFQTMNRAISLATGEFVAVYHSDDVYEPTIVAREIAYLWDNPDAGAVFCLDHFTDQSGKIFGGATLPSAFRGRRCLTFRDVFPFLLRHKNILLRCPTFLVRRTVLDDVGWFDAETYDIAADLEMWLRILRRYPVGILNERLMRYRVGKSQWSSRYHYLRTEPELYFKVMDTYLAEDGGTSGATARDLAEYEFHRSDDRTFRAANFVILGKPDEARAMLRMPVPRRALFQNLRRRKLRVLLLRTVLRAGLALGAVRSLRALLLRTEYGGLA